MREMARRCSFDPGCLSWTSVRRTSVSAARLGALRSFSWPVAVKSLVIVGIEPVCQFLLALISKKGGCEE